MIPHTYLDQGLAILQTRLQAPGAEPHAPFRAPDRPFLTISRETCAGATALGQHLLPLLDEQLGEPERSWMFLEKDLLTRALTQHQLPEHLASFLPEDRHSEIKSLIGEIFGLHPPLGELEHRVTEAIRQIALMGRVIFAGRAAHLITRNLPGGFHIRLVAPLAARVSRHQAMRGGDPVATLRHLQETDDARRRYVRAQFGEEIDDPHTYDLVVNTAHLTPATAARLVLLALRERVAATA